MPYAALGLLLNMQVTLLRVSDSCIGVVSEAFVILMHPCLGCYRHILNIAMEALRMSQVLTCVDTVGM